MKRINYYFAVVLLLLFTVSCDKENNPELVDPEYKNMELSSGGHFRIPVEGQNWYIESVTDWQLGVELLDKEFKPLFLKGKGVVESFNDWFALERDEDDSFIVSLKENFAGTDREFTICINDNGVRDYVTITQKKGSRYKLVKSDFEEIEELRKVYTSGEGCNSIVFTNNTLQQVWEPVEFIFQDVVYFSHFESDDYGAFKWLPFDELKISAPDIFIDDMISWAGTCLYRDGPVTTPYVKDIPNGNKILVEPNTTLYIRGEITYCERVCNYVFIVENESTGTQFEIKGMWKQIVPISSHIIVSETL